MAFSYSGHAASRVDRGLEDMLAEAFERQMALDQAADVDEQRAFSNDMAEKNYGLREQEFAAERANEAATLAEVRGARSAAAAKAERDDLARRNMSELVNDPQQLAAFALASGQDVPAGVRDVLKPKDVKLVKLTVPGAKNEPRTIMVPETDPRLRGEGVQEYRDPKGGGGADRGQRMWLLRGGNEVYDFYQPGDKRAPNQSNSSTTGQSAKAQATTEKVLGEIEALSSKINTVSYGPGAKATGLVRQGRALAGLDNTIAEYDSLISGFTPMIARAVGHVGVLTEQDVQSVRRLFPPPGDNSKLAKAKLDRVRRILAAGEQDLPEGTPLEMFLRGAGNDAAAVDGVETWERDPQTGRPRRKGK